jgi:branched-chain amino acid transport system permease protein
MYILLASGLSIIFGLMRVLNFAHGSLYMVGAYFGFTVISWTGNFWLALITAPFAVAVVGIAMEIITIRPLYERPHIYVIILTMALSMVFDELVHIVWGPHFYSIVTPSVFAKNIEILGQTYPLYRVFVLSFGVCLVILLWLGLNKTKLGLIVRAGSVDSKIVSALGINISRIFTITFAVGSLFAAVAGIIMGPFMSLFPGMGLEIIIISIVIVIIGGLGSFTGAVLGALLIAQVQSLSFLISAEMSNVAIYFVMFLLLLVRPHGILGKAEMG